MNASFPRIISLLRRESNISQKRAAADLGISQALLSHYEKGIRECGLDFVVKVSEYYSVSCDYLLGRSPNRNGTTLTAEELPDYDLMGKETATGNIGLLVMLNKKLISNSLGIIFDLLSKTKNRAVITEVSSFLMISIYRMLGIVFSSDAKNPAVMFSVPRPLAQGYAEAAMRRCETNASAAISGKVDNIPGIGEVGEVVAVPMNSQSLSENYPVLTPSLFGLIKNVEERINPSIERR